METISSIPLVKQCAVCDKQPRVIFYYREPESMRFFYYCLAHLPKKKGAVVELDNPPAKRVP